MATATKAFNLNYLIATSGVDFDTHTFRVILTQEGFTFVPADHEKLADITETAWITLTAYVEGDIVVPTTPNGKIYKCTTAGTTAASEPSWPTTSLGTVVDGTVTWTYDDPETAWVTLTAYTEDEIVSPVTPNGWKYKCTTAGTTAASEPSWPLVPGGTVVDGTVTWTFDGSTGAAIQVPTGNGYTQNNKALANVAVAITPITGVATVSWDDPSWVASGGYLGSTDAAQMLIGGALIYDDTHADDVFIGFIEFAAASYITDGNGLSIQDIEVVLGA